MQDLTTKQRGTWELVDNGLWYNSSVLTCRATVLEDSDNQWMKAVTPFEMKITEFWSFFFFYFNINIAFASLLFYIFGLFAIYDFSSTVFKNLPLLWWQAPNDEVFCCCCLSESLTSLVPLFFLFTYCLFSPSPCFYSIYHQLSISDVTLFGYGFFT